MRVALFASSFHPHTGGVEEVVRQLAHAQERGGGRPLVITNRWPKSLPERDEFEGLPVRRHVFRVPEHTWRQLGGAALFGSATLRRVCGDLRSHKADIIHVHCVSSNAYYAVRAARRLRLPLIVTLHGELGMDASGLFRRSNFARSLFREAIAAAEAVSACSDYVLREAREFLATPLPCPAQVIRNGINPDEFRGIRALAHSRPYILAVGRHVPQKGFDILIEGFAQLAQSPGFGHDLLLAGDGESHDGLRELAARLGFLADRVIFLGRLSHGQTLSAFLGCDFFVLPSRQEPLGIVNLEAMAAGKAVIATRVGGVPEIVADGETGILVAPGNIAELASAVRVLCGDLELAARLGEAGKRRSALFTWKIAGDRYQELYDSVVGRVPAATGT